MESYESTTRRMRSELPGVCALIQDTLPFYLEGDVSARSREFVEQHLDECDRCASFLAGGRSVQAHFHREKGSRSVVMVRDRPGQELIAAGQRRVIAFVLLVLGAVGLLVFFGVVVLGGSVSAPAPDYSERSSTEYQPTPTPVPFDPAGFAPTIVPTVAPISNLQPTEVPAP